MSGREGRSVRWVARLLAPLAMACTVAAAPDPVPGARLDFGGGRVAPGYAVVEQGQAVTSVRAGFEPGPPVVSVDRGGDPLTGDFVTSATPFLVSIPVPEGNYRVTVVLGDRRGTSSTTVKAESRRLMLDRVATRRGQTVSRSFVVNVRNSQLPPPPENAPGGSAVRLNEREAGSYTWDNKLTLEFAGSEPKLAAIEVAPVDVPTVYIAGDSTVTDQRYEPGASWGQMLPVFLNGTVAVANHAESGETMKSFLTGLRLDKALSRMKAGDTFLIQFGHNDQKQQWPQTYVDAASTYRDYLRVFIGEARRRGATPVLVTPPERRNFLPDGHIRPTLGDYAQAMRAVAAEQKVALIDLNAASTRIYEALGPQQAPLAFSAGGRDATHHDNYGAYLMARVVAEGLRGSGLPIAAALRTDLPPFDPSHPPLPGELKIDESAAHSTERPRGN